MIKRIYSSTFVPIIYTQDYDDYAAEFLRHYGFAEAITTPMQVPIWEIAQKKMGLSIYTARLSENGEDISGIIALDDGLVDIYDDTIDAYIGVQAKKGTMFLESFCTSVGRQHNSVAHECVHWWLHRLYFVNKSGGGDVVAFRCPRRMDNPSEDDIADKERMELQARGICGRILMPKVATKTRVTELLTEQGLTAETATAEQFKSLAEALANTFQVSREAALVRLSQLGYIKYTEQTNQGQQRENLSGTQRIAQEKRTMVGLRMQRIDVQEFFQEFSRTNRILNSQKRFGNIVTFRKLEKQINDACSLFGNKEAQSVVVIRPFNDYYNGYDDKPGYVQIVEELKTKFPLGVPIIGETNEKEFIKLFGAFLRVENILRPFDEFMGKEILTQRERQDYQSVYLSLNEKYRKEKEGDAVNIADDLVFEIELIKQLTVNIDYILLMVEKYIKAKGGTAKELVLADITSTIDSRPELRSKKELILGVISTVNNKTDVTAEWGRFVTEQTEKELKDVIAEENLNDAKTRKFIAYCLEDGEIKETGTDLDDILPPMSMFEEPQKRARKKRVVLEKLKAFLDKFLF